MEEDGIQAVLAKATELRLKISNCIHNSTININNYSYNSDSSKTEEENKENGEINSPVRSEAEEQHKEEDDETERLFHIRDALESLENMLSSLQALQQQQSYERQVALLEIEHYRKMLVDKLNEYRGEHQEVISEASAFAADTVAEETDLLLPPYPSRPLHSTRNGIITGDEKKNLNHVESNQAENTPGASKGGFGRVLGATAKTVITLVGVVSVLRLTGLGPNLGKNGLSVKFPSYLRWQPTEGKRRIVQCPPGKIMVVEDGEARCVVKERIAVPFDSTIAKPGVSYGSG